MRSTTFYLNQNSKERSNNNFLQAQETLKNISPERPQGKDFVQSRTPIERTPDQVNETNDMKQLSSINPDT
jgi:hypothetical protein